MLLAVQVAELYEDLKKRVSQFNMHVPEDGQTLDYTSTHRMMFILQVRVSVAHSGVNRNCCHHCEHTLSPFPVLGGHRWCLLSQLLCSGSHL